MTDATIDNDAEASVQDYPIRVCPLAEDDDPLTEDEKLYAEQVQRFFTRNILRDHVAPFFDAKPPLTRRDLTWAATNYFPERPVKVNDPHSGYEVWLHEAHERYLSEYGRDRFDPFRRVYAERSRQVRVVCDQDIEFELPKTTLAQLLWFRWALMYQFLEKCLEHREAIREHWKNSQSKRDRDRRAEQAITGRKAKRAALSDRNECGTQMVRGQFKIHF